MTDQPDQIAVIAPTGRRRRHVSPAARSLSNQRAATIRSSAAQLAIPMIATAVARRRTLADSGVLQLHHAAWGN